GGEWNQRGEGAPVGLGTIFTREIAVESEMLFHRIERGEDLAGGFLVSLLRAREAGAIDAVVEAGVDQVVPAVDLPTELFGVEVEPVAGDTVERRVQDPDDLRTLVVDDPAALLVPQDRHADLAGVARIVLGVDPVQRVAAFDRPVWPSVEGPALLGQAGQGVGNRDQAFEILEHPIGERSRSPWAEIGDPEVIAARLGGK